MFISVEVGAVTHRKMRRAVAALGLNEGDLLALLGPSGSGKSTALNALAGTVDEVVLQTYQGRQTIPGYQAYLRQLEQVKLPFKIGLVQQGEWQAPPGLSRNPNFKGYVVFLLNLEKS